MGSHYYYLHSNGDLIHKASADPADFRESDFVKMFWHLDTSNRSTAWTILVEALALGAKRERIDQLAKHWGCTDEDADHYASRLGVKLDRDGNAWMASLPSFVDLQESSCFGFGPSKLEAFSELATALGYRAQKTWGASFKDLIAKAA